MVFFFCCFFFAYFRNLYTVHDTAIYKPCNASQTSMRVFQEYKIKSTKPKYNT